MGKAAAHYNPFHRSLHSDPMALGRDDSFGVVIPIEGAKRPSRGICGGFAEGFSLGLTDPLGPFGPSVGMTE